MTSARPVPGPPPLRWWGHAWRVLVVWVTGLLILLVTFASSPAGSQELGSYPAHVDALLVADLVVGHLAVALVLWRRRFPVTVAVLTSAALVVSSLAVPASLLAALSLASRRRWRPLLAVGAVNIGAGMFYELVVARQLGMETVSDIPSPWYAGLIALLSVLLFALVSLIGWNIGGRRQLVESWRTQAETAHREQAARVAQARTAERARIAREMHDVMGHRLSLVAMHAGALAHRPDLTEAERVQSAEIVRDGAHQALQELREVLGVLRGEDDADAATGTAAPQPTLTDLPSLAAEVTTGGHPVDLTASPGLWDRSVTLSDRVGRHAYRVVQEALTNARKHAPGAAVEVDLSGDESTGLSLEVRNVVPRPAAEDPGAPGRGLTGMQERVTLVGGTFEAGGGPGVFVVRVWLPWETR
ncbi:histidine kinase [uncultured Serinicoccus sp.]|uniref:sensor histidine kinase n=1 Tax=uncultured Serinicoccus sp. TaxID=735514 RepID=UPI002628CB8C|nr:histidine kinase [uncultured Serinicoccus sp.]